MFIRRRLCVKCGGKWASSLIVLKPPQCCYEGGALDKRGGNHPALAPAGCWSWVAMGGAFPRVHLGQAALLPFQKRYLRKNPKPYIIDRV